MPEGFILSNSEFVKTIKEYSEYGNKRKTKAGIILNIFFASSALLVVTSFVFAKISHNSVFGIMMGAVLTFYAAIRISAEIKKYIAKNITSKKEKYYYNIKLARLYDLSQDEFNGLTLRCVKKLNPEINLIKDGIFYRSDNMYVVFLISADKKQTAEEKINMALNVGAEKIIAVCKDSSKENIKNKFGNKIKSIITETDIINDSPELDYAEVKQKNKMNFQKIFNAKNASKFIKLSVMCLLLSVVSVLKAYFIGLAIFFGAAGIIAYALMYRASRVESK